MDGDCCEPPWHQMWRDVWATLSYREREILKHRLRIGGQSGQSYMTQEELSRVFGVSVSTVRRISNGAAKKFNVARVLELFEVERKDA